MGLLTREQIRARLACVRSGDYHKDDLADILYNLCLRVARLEQGDAPFASTAYVQNSVPVQAVRIQYIDGADGPKTRALLSRWGLVFRPGVACWCWGYEEGSIFHTFREGEWFVLYFDGRKDTLRNDEFEAKFSPAPLADV